MNLRWVKCQGDAWCNLSTVNLDHAHFDELRGVYIIWHGGSNAATVKVGQGDIRNRLRSHRLDTEIQAYARFGLFVTWAQVSESNINGVEKYLGDRLRPKVGSNFPNVIAITVNLPW